MLKHTGVFSLTFAALLILAVTPGIPTEAHHSKPLKALSNTNAAESSLNGLGVPSVPSVEQDDAENVEFVGHIGRDTSAVAVRGDYAYIGDEKTFTIVDVSNPTSPTVVGKTPPIPTPGDVKDIAIHSDYAYVVTGRDTKLRVIDVSDPTAPAEIGSHQTPWWATEVDVSEGYAYVADDWWGLRVVDVRDPTSPTEVGYLETSRPAWASGVAVSGDYAYLAAGGGGLQVVDVSDPTNPIEVGSYDTPGYSVGVYVTGSYAYVTDEDEGLHIVDVSDPSLPTGVGSHSTPGLAVDVYVSADYAYVADWEQGLRVVDVSIPSSPAEVGYYDTPGYSLDVYVEKGYAYVADYDTGVIILRYTDFSASGRVRSSNGDPLSNVSVSTGAGGSAITNATGAYTIPGLSAGVYTIIPTEPAWVFVPPTRTVTVPPDATGQDFTMLHPPVSTTLTLSGTANLPNTLAYTDTQGLTTTLTFPRGTVTETTTVVLTPTVASGSADLAVAGHAFDLEAYQGGVHQPDFVFNEPVTVTIHYSEQDVRLVSDESQLTLRWWDGGVWQDAAETCNPTSGYVRDPAKRVLSVPICHLSRFALLGPTNRVYLPLVLRSQ